MWVDAIILEVDIKMDGGAGETSQKLQISIEDAEVVLRSEGLFVVKMNYNEWENLTECVATLQRMENEEE